MPRVRTGPYTKQRRKKWLSAARGYWGGRSKLYKPARLQVIHGLLSAYRERRRKKRVFRSLMITRINAALEPHDLSYSSFVHGLKQAGLEVDRSVLAEIAVRSPEDFSQFVAVAREGLSRAVKPA